MAAGLGSLALHAIFPVVDTRGGGQQFSIPPRKCPFNKRLVSVCISICQNQIASTVYKKAQKNMHSCTCKTPCEHVPSKSLLYLPLKKECTHLKEIYSKNNKCEW